MPKQMLQPAVAGALPRMDNLHRRTHQSQPFQPHPETHIHILAIHEIALVKPPNGTPDLHWQGDAGSIHPVHPLLPRTQQPPAKKGCRRREFALAVLYRTIRRRLKRICAATSRILTCLHQRAEGGLARDQLHVRVDDTHMAFADVCQGLVVVGTETHRCVIYYHLQHKRPSTGRHVGVRFGNVLGEHHPRNHGLSSARDLLQQSLHQFTMAMTDNGNHKAGGWKIRAAHRPVLSPQPLQ